MLHAKLNNNNFKTYKSGLVYVDKVGSNLKALIQEMYQEMFYLTTHSTHFISSYMASETW